MCCERLIGEKAGEALIKKGANLFITAYLLLIFGIYPLYMENGYVDIGESKFWFLFVCSLGALSILSIFAFMQGTSKRKKGYSIQEVFGCWWKEISATDVFVILYAVEIFVSFLLSDYKNEAYLGTEGWRVGLVLLLLLCIFYFLISRVWEYTQVVCCVGIVVSAVVFFLGIADRFSFYIIPLEIRDSAFISTLGNINWFCGYFSVIVSLGAGIFIFAEKLIWKCLLGSYLFLAFMAGFSQGSSSVFLFFGAMFLGLLWISIEKRKKIVNWFLMLSLWSFASQAVRMLRALFPQGYNYEIENLCGHLTSSNLLLFVGIGSFAIYMVLFLTGERGWLQEKGAKRVQLFIGILVVSAFVLWLATAFINTKIEVVGLANNSFFLLDNDWGNGRGAAFSAGAQIFKEMPFIHKLFGVGPDCFSIYAYSLPEVAVSLRNNFGESRLTNAHCEVLTGLVNTGIVGVVLYVSIFVSFIARCLKEEKDSFVMAVAVSAFCYLVHNFISFAQVLNLPFIFLLIAMGKSMRQKE